MENKFKKYFKYQPPEEWHSYKIGEYHISAIGISTPTNPDERTGPCLKQLYNQYMFPKKEEDMDEKEFKKKILKDGTFEMGNIVHRRSQMIYRWNNRASIAEFPILLPLKIGDDTVELRGSVDIMDFPKKLVIDLKTASRWTMPGGEKDASPSHYGQVNLYVYCLNKFIFRPSYIQFKDDYITYIKKHDLETNETIFKYDKNEGKEMWEDFIGRVRYIHVCLKNEIEPLAEPMKWCGYCPLCNKERCPEGKAYVDSKKKKKKK